MQLLSKISNLCGPDPPTSQTDRQTDGRQAISIPRYALVHRAVTRIRSVECGICPTVAGSSKHQMYRVTILTFQGHVMLSIMWPFDYLGPYAIFYRRAIDTIATRCR